MSEARVKRDETMCLLCERAMTMWSKTSGIWNLPARVAHWRKPVMARWIT